MPATRTEFYCEWFRRSVRGKCAIAEATAFFVFLVCSAISYFVPWFNVSVLLWLIPLVVFLATFVVAWMLAPYTMYRELEMRCEQASVSALANYSNRDDAKRRVEVASEQLLLYVRSADRVSTTDELNAWIKGADTLVRAILIPNIANNFHPRHASGPNSILGPQEVLLRDATSELRGIAIKLKTEHLRE